MSTYNNYVYKKAMENELKENEGSTKVSGCKSCKDPLSKTQKGILVISVYMFGTSIYGTIKLAEYLISLF